MPFFDWTEELTTGHAGIDSDHKHLVELVNTLYQAMKTGKGNDVLGKILGELITYTASHFSREEALMRKIGYAHYEEHKAEHAKLVASVLDLQAKFKAGSTTLSISVFNFLSDWLRNHIRHSDAKLGQAARGH
jgi:hemerythrin